MTLQLIQRGATKLNPVMDRLLSVGSGASLAVKYVMTAAGMTWLLMHKNYRIGEKYVVRQLMVIAAMLYAVPIVYEARMVFIWA